MRKFLFALLAAAATGLHAAEIKVLSSTALKSVIEDLAPKFEKETGHTIKAQFAPAAEMSARIKGGESFDITILTTPLMDELAKLGHIAVSSRFDLARSGATVFPAAGAASAPSPMAALAFLQYLRRSEAVKVIRAKGMEPG